MKRVVIFFSLFLPAGPMTTNSLLARNTNGPVIIAFGGDTILGKLVAKQ